MISIIIAGFLNSLYRTCVNSCYIVVNSVLIYMLRPCMCFSELSQSGIFCFTYDAEGRNPQIRILIILSFVAFGPILIPNTP